MATIVDWIHYFLQTNERIKANMSQLQEQIDALKASWDGFKTEVTTDVAALQTQVTDLNTKLTALAAQETVSPAEVAALQDLTNQITSATTDLHGKVSTPAAAG